MPISANHARCVVRATAGSACDRFGPRWTYIVLLIAGAVPTALAGTVTSFKGLIAIRCFIGILGGCLVPCEVWTTGFFDKNVVGTANAFAAGWGNAGGGITYFAMPAIFDSLVHRQHMSEHTAWRVAFVVPFILIVITAILMIFTCPDTPTGTWNARRRAIDQQMARRDMFMSTVKNREAIDITAIDLQPMADDKPKFRSSGMKDDREVGSHEQDLLEAASWELVEPPTFQRSWNAVFSLPTFAILAPYFCSFGSELAIISFLGAYYHKQFPDLSQTSSGNWASMVGLLNFFTRPAGGVISDIIYRHTGSLWGKKMLIHALGLGLGIFLLIIGLLNPESKALMFGLMVGFSFFSEASNGAGFALVPHVHPSSNGMSSLSHISSCRYRIQLIERRRHFRLNRSLWKLWRCHLFSGRALQSYELLQDDMDHRRGHPRQQPSCHLDPSNSKRSTRRPLTVLNCK